MAILKKKEIAAMNIEELQKKLNDLRLEQLKVNAQKSSKTAPRKIREIKRTIARILTSVKKSSEKDSTKIIGFSGHRKSKISSVKMLRNVNSKTKNISDINKINKERTVKK